MVASIEVRGLSRTFHSTVRRPGFTGAVRSLVNPERVAKHAVTDITFDVDPGELLALLGPNGAGKSTTIKMLTGILTPTAGHARVAGVVPYEDRERNARNIGAVFGQRTQLWWDLPVRESFAILRDIYQVPKAEHAARLAEFDGLLDLSSFWDTRVRHLSLGQRVRSDLAAALLHDPPVVFLDEPTIGMDVVVKEQVREFLRHQVEERGRTVLLTTHDMTEVERLAERVVLVNHGRLVLDGTLDEIRRKFGSTWQIRTTLADPHTDLVPLRGIALQQRSGSRLVFGPDGPDAPTVHQALKAVIEAYEVTDIALDDADLEDVMRAAYVHAEEV
ncbi:ATP-binding cassette domain-containing protein [Streptomyces sp. NPDC020489]|uniref:ATP-binding cassette domain-containing protein n=1 Tax=Streptomyces sp. NPDC020489 TaxID=3365077 RepID=UPI0037B4D298